MRDFICGIKAIIVPNECPILADRDGYCGEQKIRGHINRLDAEDQIEATSVVSGLLFVNSNPFLSVIEFRHHLPESIYNVQG